MTTILMVTTSNADLSGHPTGVWLEEYAVPYMALQRAGVTITVASPKGGEIPIDPRSSPTEEQTRTWASAITAARTTERLADLQAADFDGIFLPGGHGPMFDLPDNADLQRLLTAFDALGRVIGAVCHGPAGLVNARGADGRWLVDGKRLTAYSYDEEVLAKLDRSIPFVLDAALSAHGALYEKAAPRQPHVVRDGRLITGQNPASSEAIAASFLQALGVVAPVVA